jgi:hypothetical protein
VIRCQPSVAKPSRLEQQPFGLSFAFRLGRGMEWNILPANSWRPRRIHSGEVIGCWSRRCLTSGSLLSHPSIRRTRSIGSQHPAVVRAQPAHQSSRNETGTCASPQCLCPVLPRAPRFIQFDSFPPCQTSPIPARNSIEASP